MAASPKKLQLRGVTEIEFAATTLRNRYPTLAQRSQQTAPLNTEGGKGETRKCHRVSVEYDADLQRHVCRPFESAFEYAGDRPVTRAEYALV